MNRDNDLYLEGLASYGVIFTQVVPGTKRTTRTWDHFEEMHEQRGGSRLDLVHKWLRKGDGVGYLLRGGLAAVDADDLTTVQRIAAFEDNDGYLHFPKVTTPSGGIHAHFQHPPTLDLTRVKNHVCHPMEDGKKVPWDFKLNTRTMLMAPGTVMPKGVYQAGIWSPPPILDIRYLAPELKIFKPEGKPYLIDQRPFQSRILRAMNYLKRTAPVSIEGQGPRKALRAVAEHLVVDLDLDPSLAFYLMTETKVSSRKDADGKPIVHVAWNDRCLNAAGKSAPWSDDALWDALDDAVDAVPLHGVLLHQAAEEKQFARWSSAAFIEMLTFLPEPKGSIYMTSDAIYSAFIEFSGVVKDAFEKCELGLEITRALDQGRLPFVERGHIRTGSIYRGLDLNTLRIAMDTYEQRQKVHAAAS